MSPQPTSSDAPKLVRFDGLSVLDAHGTLAAPGSVLVEFAARSGSIFPARVLAVGRSAEVDRHEAGRAPGLRTIARPNAVLIPGLVNAHTHLDLSHIGPQAHDPAGGFMPWIDMIRARREADPARIASSVRRGIALSLAAGTVAVGDIAGAVRAQIPYQPWQTLRESPLIGVSWVEFFGIGKGRARTEEMLARLTPEIHAAAHADPRVRLGLQPHAPNTVARSIYAAALEIAATLGHEAPISTHLAESPEEHRFVAEAVGPQRDLLEALGLWDDSIPADLGKGLHPVAHMQQLLARTPFTVAHVNDADDEAVATLARTRTRVVYCPRASAYFGADVHFGPHRYQEMLTAGICVALGTDSIVNLPPEAGRLPSESPDGRGMSILDEMRFLHTRDDTDPVSLLQMGTTNGARALGLPEEAFKFRTGGALAGLVAVPIAEPARDLDDLGVRMMMDRGALELLFASIYSDSTEHP
jgi:cytosine/adenosine deaminase-related metal-dependent hydrolase